MVLRPLLMCVVVLVLGSSGLRSQVPALPAAGESRPFPFVVLADEGSSGLLLEAPTGSLEALQGLLSLTLEGVPLPGARSVDLALERLAVADGRQVLVDGVAQGETPAAVMLWRGRVVGEPGSDAYLALSRHGSRGWIRTAGRLVHLLALPGAGGDWTSGRSRLVDDAAVRALGLSPRAVPCRSSEAVQPFAPPLPVSRPAASSPLQGAQEASAYLPLHEATIALETDVQYFELFGSVPAADAYLMSLFGAVSSRYREQVGTILVANYTAYYTSNDPWVSADQGLDCLESLFEFQDAWDFGGAPVTSDVYHFVSGAWLGCGVAYLDVLCVPDYNFGLSCCMGVSTPFPIVPNHPLNWDFIVMAHEIGHNFGSPHTQDFCPPLDECWEGACTAGGICTTEGTVMSYCHICDDNGMQNMTTFFHPDCAAVMRSRVEPCLPLFEGLSQQLDLGFALAGSNGLPALQAGYSAAPATLHLDLEDGPPSKPGLWFLATTTLYAPFKGGTLVPAIASITSTASQPSGEWSVDVPVLFSFPDGISLVSQLWFKEGPGNWAASNGLSFELVQP